MKFLPKEAWRYAFLLIILFAIAAVTVHEILEYLREPLSAEHFRVISFLMSALTLGFMLIAGAFGLWAIRFSAEAESRRRIGRFVDAMDYLSDGILTLDGKGQITGSNPVFEKSHHPPIGWQHKLLQEFSTRNYGIAIDAEQALSSQDYAIMLRKYGLP